MSDGDLDVLLVEDNPGDARYIEEIFREATELSERALGSRTGGLADRPLVRGEEGLTLRRESRLADGLAAVERRRPDIVLLDLGLPDSTGLETLDAALEAVGGVPVVVLTGISDRSVGIEALERGADEYLVKDEITADLLVRSVYHAIERTAHERHLEQQRERLAALNQLYGVIQGVIQAVVEQSTREEVEQTVCERFAAAPAYEFAWVGAVESTSDAVVVRAQAGGDGYLEDLTVSADPADPHGQGPTGEAIRTGEVQVTPDASEDPDYEPWRDGAAERGFRSSAAIPIAHEGTLYGVLNVYAGRPNAFTGEEREVIEGVGEIVGHAIAAIERKRTLMSDEVVEVDFRVPDLFGEAAVDLSDRVTLDRVVPVDDEYRVYGSAAAADRDAVGDLVGALAHWEHVEVVAEAGDRVTFEARLSGPSVLTTVATQGGDVKTAAVEDGTLRVTAQFPHNAAVRAAVADVEAVYPQTAVQAQRMVDRDGDWSERVLAAFEDSLTDRQRAILETAYFRGYFEWPRESSGEEIADSLDLSPPTFSEHLRGAENRIFGALFEDDADGA